MNLARSVIVLWRNAVLIIAVATRREFLKRCRRPPPPRAAGEARERAAEEAAAPGIERHRAGEQRRGAPKARISRRAAMDCVEYRPWRRRGFLPSWDDARVLFRSITDIAAYGGICTRSDPIA